MKNHHNATQEYTASDLRSDREKLNLGPADMARVLMTPLRTYEDWESGRRQIPGVVGVAMRLKQEQAQWLKDRMEQRIDADMGRFNARLTTRLLQKREA